MKVNLVDLCSHFANIATEAYSEGAKEVCQVYNSDNLTLNWTEKYQTIFDNYYDEYWDIMIQYGFKHENK